MLETEVQWSAALASNNIRAIIRWLRTLIAEGDVDVEETLLTFSCWVQRTSEFAKKELLTLCFSRCQGQWMFLDRSSFTRVHMLLQRLRNLLTLAQWARRQLTSAHLWHGVGVPCVVCKNTFGSSDVRRGCWNREHRALKQHIWLGRLVQWWGIMGLLPKHPEAQEVKRISQMWRGMDHSHQKAYLETLGWEEEGVERWSSFIQSLVTQLDKQHGCIWTSEDRTDQCYPPPNLQALLKLVLVPRIDNMSVQAILMYFTMDMANFLQCKNDLLQSFCHAFTVPSSFSQLIRAFWMLDHGHVKASMELLLSPRAAVPWLPWQHRCVIHCLLMRKQPRLALRYLHWTRPAIECTEDAKLCADVLLQNSCVSDAWALLKRGHTEGEDMVMYFLQACNGFGLCTQALKYIPAACIGEGNSVNGIEATELKLMKKDCSAGRPPCPLSARLSQAQRVKTLSPEELVRLVRKAVMEVRNPHPKLREVVWPEQTERKLNSREMFLSTQALRHLTPSPSLMDMAEERTAYTDQPEEEQSLHNQHHETHKHIPSSEDLSSESASSFTSASSLPLLRRGRPHVYESTLTLQRISSFLTDGENQSREDEEEESRPSSLDDVLPHCPEQMLTPDGATDTLNNVNKAVSVELVLPAEEGEEDVQTGFFSSEDFLSVDAVSGPSMDEPLPLNKSFRLNHRPQLCGNEVSQSVASPSEPQVERHSFLSPDFERREKTKEIVHGLSDVTELWSTVLSQGDQSDHIPAQDCSFNEAAISDCFLEEELHQKTCEQQQQAQDLSTSLLTDAHGGPGALARMGDSSLLTPVCSLIFPTQLHIPGSCLTPSQTSAAPSDTTNESLTKAQLKADEPHVQSSSAIADHFTVGGWLKQDFEACGASSGFLLATEPGAALTSGNKRPSLVLSQPYSYSLLSFMELTARQKGDSIDGKQADKEAPAGWGSLGKASQGAIRSGRARSRRGKRVKRV